MDEYNYVYGHTVYKKTVLIVFLSFAFICFCVCVWAPVFVEA